ncbi:MAG: hypothetical protein ABI321_13360 [Polyangia bacterium]
MSEGPPSSSRRRLLRVGLFGSALLAGAAVIGRNVSGYVLPRGLPSPTVLSVREVVILAAVVERICATDGPDAPRPDGYAIASWLDGYIAGLDVPLRRDLSALLSLLEHGSALFRLGATRFSHMSTDEQDRTLADWCDSRLDVRRQGFQALRALAFLGYYRDDRTFALLGYPGPMVARR